MQPRPIVVDAKQLHRKRDREFVIAFIEELAKATELSDDVLFAAAEKVYSGGCIDGEGRRRKLVAIAKKKLALSPVMSAIGDYFEAETGFSLGDALRLHVSHITGKAPKKANYAALRDYEKLTLPQPAKHLRIDQTHAFNLDGRQPEIDPRPIGGMTLDAE